jgi:hypothetical protein
MTHSRRRHSVASRAARLRRIVEEPSLDADFTTTRMPLTCKWPAHGPQRIHPIRSGSVPTCIPGLHKDFTVLSFLGRRLYYLCATESRQDSCLQCAIGTPGQAGDLSGGGPRTARIRIARPHPRGRKGVKRGVYNERAMVDCSGAFNAHSAPPGIGDSRCPFHHHREVIHESPTVVYHPRLLAV